MFDFKINDAGYLPVAKAWYLDGILESGAIETPCTAECMLEDEAFAISIRSVALIGGDASGNDGRFTLSIEDPGIAMGRFVGKRLRIPGAALL